MASSPIWSSAGDDPSPDSVLAPAVDPAATAKPVEPGHVVSLRTLSDKLHTDAAIPSIGITVLAMLAVIYTLYFGHAFFVPVMFAVLLNFLLSPVVRAARRIGIPSPMSAALVILVMIGVLGIGAYELAAPARGWLTSAPATLSKAEVKLRRLLKPVDQVTRTAEQVEKVTSATNNSNGPAPTAVVVQGPSMRARLFGTTQNLIGTILEVLVLLFFLLAAGDLFLEKLIKVLPQRQDKQTAFQIARETESSISMYLMTSALLNVAEGSVVALAMFLLHMPDAILWGVLVAVMEFIPYVGAAAVVIILSIAALTVFDTTAQASLIPVTFLAINLVQGNLVSPLVFGHRLAVNPVAMFIGLAFWWELWGVAGAFLAVPLLATLKIFCDHIDTLAPIGEFLGRRDDSDGTPNSVPSGTTM